MSDKPAIPFSTAFLYWLKLGFISFGGPAGQISMMHQELVEKKKWISEHRFLHALNYCMILPGPEAQQLATYIGWLMHGTIGGIIAGGLFVLPSFFILCLLTYLYLAFGDIIIVKGVLYGIKPAVTAIVLFAAYRIGSRALKNLTLWLIAALAFIVIIGLKIDFPFIILGAAIIGVIGSYLSPQNFKAGGGHKKSEKEIKGPWVIDDTTATPEHAKFKRSKLFTFVIIGLMMWGLVYSGLVYAFGWGGVLPQMAIFFSKAAVLTFGGAYAVLPYVYQGGVETYQWLTPQQMIDGLALGETTPGPLIMVVSYVGFVGGWTKQIFANHLILSGIVAATVVTFFTFLPSFLFILIGGPLVEATRNEIKYTAPLTAITAAVVGVILYLACFFAYHVFFPSGFNNGLSSQIEWPAIIICIISIVALFRFKIGITTVIAATALIGIALQFTIK